MNETNQLPRLTNNEYELIIKALTEFCDLDVAKALALKIETQTILIKGMKS